VLASRGYFSEEERVVHQRVVGLQEESGILYTLGQTEELLPSSRVVCNSPALYETSTSHSTGKSCGSPLSAGTALALGRRLFLLLERPILGGLQWSAQGDLQGEFLLDSPWSVRQSLEQLQPLGEMADRFYMGRTLARSLSGLLPVRNRLCGEAASV